MIPYCAIARVMRGHCAEFSRKRQRRARAYCAAFSFPKDRAIEMTPPWQCGIDLLRGNAREVASWQTPPEGSAVCMSGISPDGGAMNRIIPGKLDLHALALLSDPAQAHRPTDPESLAREGRALLALGLSVADASQALALPPRALADLLSQHPED